MSEDIADYIDRVLNTAAEESRLPLARYLKSPLDRIETRYDQPRAMFFACAGDSMPTVSLFIDDGEAIVASSSCLTTRSWREQAEAYARAAAFIRDAGLTDGGMVAD